MVKTGIPLAVMPSQFVAGSRQHILGAESTSRHGLQEDRIERVIGWFDKLSAVDQMSLRGGASSERPCRRWLFEVDAIAVEIEIYAR